MNKEQLRVFYACSTRSDSRCLRIRLVGRLDWANTCGLSNFLVNNDSVMIISWVPKEKKRRPSEVVFFTVQDIRFVPTVGVFFQWISYSANHLTDTSIKCDAISF